MQPSYVYCKYCGYYLTRVGSIGLPTDNEDAFYRALATARANILCPCCGNKKWIRKVARKVI